MQCQTCGVELKEDSNFCSYCGNPNGQKKEIGQCLINCVVGPNDVWCSKCGEYVNKDTDYQDNRITDGAKESTSLPKDADGTKDSQSGQNETTDSKTLNETNTTSGQHGTGKEQGEGNKEKHHGATGETQFPGTGPAQTENTERDVSRAKQLETDRKSHVQNHPDRANLADNADERNDNKQRQYQTSHGNKTTENPTEFFDVDFNVLVSPTLFTSRKELVYIHHERGWSEMRLERMTSENTMHFRMVLRFDRSHLINGFNYTYCIKENGEHVYWESAEKKYERCFRLKNAVRGGKYVCYDGFVREPLEKITRIEPGHNNTKMIMAVQRVRILSAVSSFMPELKLSQNKTGEISEEFLNRIEFIFNGIIREYKEREPAKYSHNEVKTICSEELKKNMLTIIDKMIAIRKRPKFNDYDYLMAAAVTILYLQLKYKFEFEETDERNFFICLCPVSPGQECKKPVCPEFTNLHIFFPYLEQREQKIRECVRQVVQTLLEDTSRTHVFFCLPLLHFLHEQCRPYEVPSLEVNHTDKSPKWWGTELFNKQLQNFKKGKKWNRNENEVLRSIHPYFSLDYFLPRAFAASLTFEKFVKIEHSMLPVDVSLATLYHFINDIGIFKTHSDIEKIKSVVDKLPVILLKSIEDTESENVYGACYRTIHIAKDVFEVLYREKKASICITIIEVILIAYDCVQKTKAENEEKPCREIYNQKVEMITHLLSEEHSTKREGVISQLWNRVFSLEVPNGTTKQEFVSNMQDMMASSLTKVMQKNPEKEEKLLNIFLKHFECYHEKIQEVLSGIFSNAVEQGCPIDIAAVCSQASIVKLAETISNAFQKACSPYEKSDHHTCLNFVLGWRPFPKFLKLFHHQDLLQKISKQNTELMKRFIKILKQACGQLVDGGIQLQDLELFNENIEQFFIIYDMKELKNEPMHWMKILSYRELEFKLYFETAILVQDLKQLCSLFYRGELENIPDNRGIDRQHIILNEVWKIISIDEMEKEHPQRTSNMFGLDEHELYIIQSILECKRSKLFMKLWYTRGMEVCKDKNNSVNVKEIISDVWNHVYEEWNDLVSKLYSGDITFIQLIKTIQTDNEPSLRQEFEIVSTTENNKWIESRLDQFRRYKKLKQCLTSAKAIMNVVKKFDLKGNFRSIQKIIDLDEDADTKMNSFDETMIATCETLKRIQDNQAKCLDTFCQCKPLVDWLRDTISDLKELKVFVDLASISAGEGDMEIDKVNCFHSATTGYAALIFNLSKKVHFEEFHGLCRKVWKELETNPDLMIKLVDTNRNLDWLKNVSRTHGSVEVTSLSQVEEINKSGSYYVGNIGGTVTFKSMSVDPREIYTGPIWTMVKTGTLNIKYLICNINLRKFTTKPPKKI